MLINKIILIIIVFSISFSEEIRYIDEVFESVIKTEDVVYGNAPAQTEEAAAKFPGCKNSPFLPDVILSTAACHGQRCPGRQSKGRHEIIWSDGCLRHRLHHRRGTHKRFAFRMQSR